MLASAFKALFATESITALQWVGEDRLVVAGLKAMGLYNLEGQLLESIAHGARRLAWRPGAEFVRFLQQHADPVECSTPRDWYWGEQDIRRVDPGVYYTNCGLFDPVGNYVHGGELYDTGYCKVMDAEGQKKAFEPRLPIVMDLAFSPQGTQLLIGCKRLQLSIWSYSEQMEREKTYQSQTGIFSVAWSDSGRYIAAGQVTGIVEIWDLVSEERVAEIIAVPAYKLPWETLVRKIHFLPGSDHLLLVSTNEFTRLIHWQERKTIRSAKGYNCSALSPSGQQIALGSTDGRVCCSDASLQFFEQNEQSTNKA